MDDTIKQLIYDAQLVTREGEAAVADALHIRRGVLLWAGYSSEDISDEAWDEYIPKMPKEIQGVMIAFDDAINCQDSTSLMYNL